MKLIRSLLWIWCVMPASVLFAQPAPTIVSTLQTTNSSATSLSVGCAVGSSTCTGGISFGSAAGNTISLSGGYLELQSNVPGTTTYRLYNNAGNLYFNGVALATGASLSGTTGKLAKFTGVNTVGDSICSESGATLTCATVVSATTLTGTLSTASQPNVTTMAGLVSLGTLTTGVWNATKIGLVYGGTNADLSATGGASQFLRQASVGAAVTVVRPAVADLSDGSHVIVDTGSYSDPAWLAALSATKLTSGTLPDARLTTNVPLLNGATSYNDFTTGLRAPQVCDHTVTTSCMSPQLGTLIVGGTTRFSTDAVVLGTTLVSGSGGVNLGADTAPTAISADVNNYDVEITSKGTLIRIGGNAVAHNITGISSHGSDGSGRFFWLVNLSGATLTLKNDSGSSTAGNRFYCPGLADFALLNNKSVLIMYSAADSHWFVLASS